MRELARRLLAASRDGSGGPDERGREALLVTDRLRTSLSRFAGPDGFASLMNRALVLASEDVPALDGIRVDHDGRLDGWDRLAADGAATRDDALVDAEIAITAHLLALLVTTKQSHGSRLTE